MGLTSGARHKKTLPFPSEQLPELAPAWREREKKKERNRERKKEIERERELNQQATETDKHGQVVAELLHSDYSVFLLSNAMEMEEKNRERREE